MKIADVIVSLLNDELKGNPCILKVVIPITQGNDWTWMLLYFEDPNKTDNIQKLNIRLLELLSPVHAGEIAGHSIQPFFYYAESNFIPEMVATNILFQSPLGDTLPRYVKEALSSNKNTSSPFFFIRIKKEVSIIDADYLAHKIWKETWFQARTLPYSLSYRQVEITVGAQRKSLVPQIQQPILCFEWDRGYYAAFHNPAPERAVKYHLYCNEGRLKTIICSRDDFLSAINFPVGEGYGFDMVIPLEFDAFLPSSNDAASTLLHALKESSEAHHKLRKVVRQRLNETKLQTVERLEERRRRLRERKSVVLQSKGQERILGFEPTNENELIILATKLEDAIAKKIGNFRILEHTGQLGIDGLIQIRRTPESMLEEAASVEFEYELGNFFKHIHPVIQTNYIICWTIGKLRDGIITPAREGVYADAFLVVELRANDWMKVLSFYDHVIYVLPLENFPDIIVKKTNN